MNNFIKKIAIAALTLAAMISCKQDRDNVLKVYNWSNYIGENVVEDFKSWYKECTGEDIEVIYQTFDVNETMLAKIEKGHEDFDLTCPSDYIIERMLNNGLLLPLDLQSIPDSINYIKNCRSQYMSDLLGKVSPLYDANDYSVPFMWGTVGILYNAGKVTDEEASTFDIIRNPKFAGKIFIKDAPRDVFCPVLMHLKQKELAAGEVTLDELMHDSSDESIAAVEAFMKQSRDLVAGWEADFGKEQMTQERGYVSLNWSGDAMWAIEEAEEVGVKLKYSVPKEGSNVWLDGWVIPKYAKNVKAATWFINFMCRPDIAIRNMDETGYVSACGDIRVLESQIDSTLAPVDVSYFFGPGAAAAKVNPVMYPDKEIISHCALMHDWGKDTDKLISMWSRIKGKNADSSTLIVIVAFVSALIGAGVVKHSRNSRKKNRKRR